MSFFSTTRATALRIYKILTPAEKRATAGLFGLMLVGMLLETLGVGMVVPAIAVLTQPDFPDKFPALQPLLGGYSQQDLVAGGMLALVAAYLVKSLFMGGLLWRQASFAFSVQAELSQRLFTVYLHQPYIFHLQRNSAQLVTNVTSEASNFTFSVVIPSLTLCTEALVLAGFGVLLVAVEPLGTLVIAATLGAATWGFYALTQGSVARWGQIRQWHEGLRMQHLQQGLGGAKEVKLLGRESEFIAQYHVHNKHVARVLGLQQTLQQLPRLWLELLGVAGIAVLVLALLAQGRELQSILPTLGLFAAAAFRLIPSANRILVSAHALRFGLPVIDTVHAELQLAMPEGDGLGQGSARFSSALELDHVTFRYPGASGAALKEVCLVVRRGESVGIVGASGAGKSTLINVILGLLAPDSGRVLADGAPIGQALRGWQEQIGYVPQSIYLTDDTLRRNVAFGLSDDQIDQAAVSRAVRAAQLESFAQSLPQGLDTMVGELGARLSGGQRQRIGIARALYHDPAVLVLDEATSSLDTATEQGVVQAVSALQGKKTVIIVAHRLSTVGHCQRLYRLEGGEVIEEGSFDEVTRARRAQAT